MERKIAVALMFVLLVSSLLPALALAATGRGLDLQAYCERKGWGDAQLFSEDAYGWKCVSSTGRQRDMDLYEACRLQFGNGYEPEMGDFDDPNSWTCVSDRSTPVSSDTQTSDCSELLEENVALGDMAQVTMNPPSSNNLRNQPGITTEVLAIVPPGTIFQVIGGPVCASSLRYWQIQLGNTTGWMADGDINGTQRWIEPADTLGETADDGETLGQGTESDLREALDPLFGFFDLNRAQRNQVVRTLRNNGGICDNISPFGFSNFILVASAEGVSEAIRQLPSHTSSECKSVLRRLYTVYFD